MKNILHTIKRRTANWIGHFLHRDCFLKYAIKGKIEGTGRGGKRRQRTLDDLKEKRRYWKMKAQAPVHIF